MPKKGEQHPTVTSSEVAQTVAKAPVYSEAKSSYIEEEPVYTEGVYELYIVESLLHNDSVGNDWQRIYTCNGEPIEHGKRWTIPLDTTETFIIEITITKNDKWPDTGSGTLSLSLVDSFEASVIINISENKGRYKGNTAQWQITCGVKLMGWL